MKFISEGANMPLDAPATETLLANDVYIGPAKAANAGGVAVSALEMAQNSQRQSWTFEEVDGMLQDIMKNIFSESKEAASTYGKEDNLINCRCKYCWFQKSCRRNDFSRFSIIQIHYTRCVSKRLANMVNLFACKGLGICFY